MTEPARLLAAALRAPWALVVVVALCLAGCGSGVDPGASRLCRVLAAGLAGPEADRISVLWLRGRPATAERGGPMISAVEVAFEMRRVGRAEAHLLACRFVHGREGGIAARHLVGVVLDGRRFGAERLHLARRFWLELPESAAADPEPVAGVLSAVVLPRGLALALQTAVAGLPAAGIYVLLALANALILGLAGRVSLVYGELAALASYGAALGSVAAGGTGNPALALTLGLVGGAWVAGTWGGLAGSRLLAPLDRRSVQASLIASLAAAVALGEIARLAQGAGARPSPPLLDAPLALGRAGDYVVTVTPMALIATAMALAVTLAVLGGVRRSRFGRWWRAASDDPFAARLMGVDPRRLAVATYAIAGLLAGCAGTVVALALGGVTHGTGLVIGIKALMAAVLGGSGSLVGAAMAAFLVGALEAAWSAVLPIEHRDAAVLVLVSLALVLRPGGIAGQPVLERH